VGGKKARKPMKVLLHICCGVCAASVAERLMCEGYTVTGFFYNPNIHPVDEYKKRLKAAHKAAEQLGFELVEGPYDRERWFEVVKGLEYEGEGGKRCEACFRMRLEKTYEYFRKKGEFKYFTTTLTVSPMKDAIIINEIGREIGSDRFITANFKAKGGFQRASELAGDWDLYRQHYCGCIYSKEEMLKKQAKKQKEEQ
jgi:predicted adenine nucleotide alpha hydrolase (AANH) superfamily ATPase